MSRDPVPPSGDDSSRPERESVSADEPSGGDHRLSRRAALRLLAAGGVATQVASLPTQLATGVASATETDGRRNRLETAFAIRKQAAKAQLLAGEFAPNPTNGDEERYETKLASYSKGLPHDERGLVDLDAYEALVAAIEGEVAYETIPLGGTEQLVNPAAGGSYNMTGLDPHDTVVEPPPAFASAETAAEMVELYWQALLRDVPFGVYEDNCLAREAAAELSSLDGFFGPTENGTVTPERLFRGALPGTLDGPYVSQFFYKDVQRGEVHRTQRFAVAKPGRDYLTDFDAWLAVQNGHEPEAELASLDDERYMVTGRDLATWVRTDTLSQAFLNAAFVLLDAGVPFDDGNPYADSPVQSSFVDYGMNDIVSGVAGIAIDALHAAWYHKWFVHRRLRPEAYGGRVHVHLTGDSSFPIHDQLLESAALERTVDRYGTYLLPQAYPEGCPLHPSFPGGHGTVGGACATVLKAFFDGSANVPDPVRPTDDGTHLESIDASLTVNGELNKLVANHALGRNWAGIHYLSNGGYGWRLGEQVAINWLEDRLAAKATPSELTLTTFDGETRQITPSVNRSQVSDLARSNR